MEWVHSSNSFVFSLLNAVCGPVRLRCTEPEDAIGCYSSDGPLFGCGSDIDISGHWTRAGGECSCDPCSYTTCDPAFTVTPVTHSSRAQKKLVGGRAGGVRAGGERVGARQAAERGRRSSGAGGAGGEERFGGEGAAVRGRRGEAGRRRGRRGEWSGWVGHIYRS
jgi:hypothetical protein